VRDVMVLGYRPTTGSSGTYAPCPGGCSVSGILPRYGNSRRVIGYQTTLGNIDLYFQPP